MIDKLKRRRPAANRGMTLVEVIVSLALLGILAAMLLVVFTSSLMLAVNSGDNTIVTGYASTKMNKSLVDPEGYADKTSADTTAEVRFKQQSSNRVSVPGQVISTEESSGKNEATMKSFVPD